jgi:hypothetical protein
MARIKNYADLFALDGRWRKKREDPMTHLAIPTINHTLYRRLFFW